MIFTLAIAALTLLPSDDVAVDQVDMVEVNHFYGDRGEHVFDQVIFYDWCDGQCRYQVRAWRLLKSPAQIPQKNFHTGEYETLWHDGDVMRRVRSKVYRESWTQVAPEMRERSVLPKEHRRGLTSRQLESDHAK